MSVGEKDRSKLLKRYLVWSNHYCCGWGNQLGGLIGAWELANISQRTFVVSWGLFDKVVDQNVVFGTSARERTEAVRLAKNHSFDFSGFGRPSDRTSFAEALYANSSDSQLLVRCARASGCCFKKFAPPSHLAHRVPTRANLDRWREIVPFLFASTHLARPFVSSLEKFRQRNLVAASSRWSGLPHIAIQVRLFVDASNGPKTPEDKVRPELWNAVRKQAQVLLLHNATNLPEKDISSNRTMVMASRANFWLTSNDQESQCPLFESSLASLGGELFCERTKFADTRKGALAALVDWYMLGEMDYAIVAGTTFSFSAALRSSKTTFFHYNGEPLMEARRSW